MQDEEFEKLNNVYNQVKTLFGREKYMEIASEKPMAKFHDVLEDHMVESARETVDETREEGWKAAGEHLEAMIEQYSKLIGLPKANPWYVLKELSDLKKRYLTGERSDVFYKRIMEME